jgi:hypothetical protein
MPLLFQNSYKDTAYVSMVWFDRSCGDVPWKKMGWFVVAPGKTFEFFSGDLRNLPNHNFAWFAVAGNSSGPTWSGDTHYRIPTNAAFNQCHMDDTGCDNLRPFFVGRIFEDWLGLTILLLAPGASNQPNQGCVWGLPLYPPEPKPPKVGSHK